MKNRQDNRTACQPPPSWSSIAGHLVLVVSAVSVVVQLLRSDGEAADLGAVGWALVAAHCAGELIDRIARRLVWRSELRDERERNTGIWVDQNTGDRVTVRWDPQVQAYLMVGPDRKGFAHEQDADYLTRYLQRMEDLGFVPADDEATRALRDRLEIEVPSDLGKPHPY